MKKILLGMVLVLFAAGLLMLRPVQAGLLGLWTPPYPNWPATERLDARAEGEIHYPTATVYDLQVILGGMQAAIPTTGLGYLSLPQGASAEHPVPAMVILPGSGGISPGRERDYAKLLNDHGYAAFIVEYYLPRGMTEKYSYMQRAGTVTDFDVASDAYAALKLLSTDPAIDPARIGVMGFSYGGMAVRHTMDARLWEKLAPDTQGFAAHADFYGPCFQVLNTQKVQSRALLALRGTADASNDLPACARREKELADLGVKVERHTFDGAGHAWENAGPAHMSAESPYISCEIHYDDAGRASVNGKSLGDLPLNASREERIIARMTSAARLRGCVHRGYIIGRNETARAQGYTLLLDFLDRHLKKPGA